MRVLPAAVLLRACATGNGGKCTSEGAKPKA